MNEEKKRGKVMEHIKHIMEKYIKPFAGSPWLSMLYMLVVSVSVLGVAYISQRLPVMAGRILIVAYTICVCAIPPCILYYIFRDIYRK